MKRNATTLKQFKVEFLEYVKGNGCTDASVRSYEHTIRKLLEYPPIADAPLNDISPRTIAKFTEYALVHRQVSKATLNRYLSVLRSVLRYSHKLGLIAFEPNIRMLNCKPRQPHLFTEDECLKWLDCCSEPLRSISLLAMQTGMRVGEILALQKDNVVLFDQANDTGAFGSIEVEAGLKAPHRRRTVPLSRELRDSLRVLTSRSECRHVFTCLNDPSKPLPASSVSRQVVHTRSKGGFPQRAGLHTFRSTFISKMLEVSPPHVVARIVGYSIPTTLRFMHFDWDRNSVAKVLGCTDIRTAHIVREAKPATQFQQPIRKLWASVRAWITQKFAPQKKRSEMPRPASLAFEGDGSKN